ncbi:hypothetical protein FRX31_031945 [Thalictrum thalictroides]|uniref:Uncharacterized protein n=1 Tax=Thalictrum thalictroides TaxID=46969 RepID=A0A7J6V2X7_THATH|nr:hypothetical protein FRX31_031945 [Thalictrum thalictroides]
MSQVDTPSLREKDTSGIPNISCVTKRKSTKSKVDSQRRKKKSRQLVDNTSSVGYVASQEADDDNITEEEIELLNPNHWYNTDRTVYEFINVDQAYKDNQYKLYHSGMGLVREAYLSTKDKTRGTDIHIVKLLRDDFSMMVLLQFANCLKLLYDFTKRTAALRTILSKAINSNPNQAHSAAVASDFVKCFLCAFLTLQRSPPAVSNLSAGHLESPAGQKKFSTKIHRVLLVLSEIITQMQIGPQDSKVPQGYKEDMGAVNDVSTSVAENLCVKCGINLKSVADMEFLKAVHDVASSTKTAETQLRMFVDYRLKSFQNKFETGGFVKRYKIGGISAELMHSVEAGMHQLMTDVKKENLLLVDLIGSVYKSFAPGTAVLRRGRACNDGRKILVKELNIGIRSFISFLCGNEQDLIHDFSQYHQVAG